MRYGDIPGATETFLFHGPMMQISYQWSQADINAVSGNITMKLDGKDVTFNAADATSFAINRNSDGTATEKRLKVFRPYIFTTMDLLVLTTLKM